MNEVVLDSADKIVSKPCPTQSTNGSLSIIHPYLFLFLFHRADYIIIFRGSNFGALNVDAKCASEHQ